MANRVYSKDAAGAAALQHDAVQVLEDVSDGKSNLKRGVANDAAKALAGGSFKVVPA